MRLVMKFGGTSVGSADAIRRVTEIVGSYARDHEVVVVVSAMNAPDLRTTDTLIAAAKAAAAGNGDATAQIAPRLLDLHMRTAAEVASPAECAALEPQIQAMLDYMSNLSR
ncbi:MAG: aspartate kinase, partial [Chloroflexus sp.]|nr:aspartate kinase [Chloroflexus sp.]